MIMIVSLSYAKSSVIMPSDYESRTQYIKVSSEFAHLISEKVYTFQLCQGSINDGSCQEIKKLSESRLSKTELKKNLYGSALMAAEFAVGFGLWKNLVRLTLPAFYKAVQKSTGWTEGVANGTVALVPATVTSAGVVVLSMNTLNSMYQNIDPFHQFNAGNLFDTNLYDTTEEVIISKLSSQEIIQLLKD